jgi:hypothetical protein
MDTRRIAKDCRCAASTQGTRPDQRRNGPAVPGVIVTSSPFSTRLSNSDSLARASETLTEVTSTLNMAARRRCHLEA